MIYLLWILWSFAFSIAGQIDADESIPIKQRRTHLMRKKSLVCAMAMDKKDSRSILFGLRFCIPNSYGSLSRLNKITIYFSLHVYYFLLKIVNDRV